MTPSPNSDGYLKVGLPSPGRNKPRHVTINALVAEAFLGPRPTADHQAAHWDGDKTHNALANIRWATPEENAADRERHGRTFHPVGELHPQSKLTEADVIEIRNARAEGVGRLAAKFAVSRWTIFDIWSGRSWGHLSGVSNV